MRLIKILIFVIGMTLTGCNVTASTPGVEILSPVEFQAKLSSDSNAYLLDVRKPEEFDAGHLEGAHQLDWLDPDNFKSATNGLDKNKLIYVYCRSGRRSNEAASFLAGQGYKVVDMDGGILAWEKNNLPLVKGIDKIANQFETQGISHDSFTTKSGHDVKIHFIKHASLIIEINGKLVYIDPTGIFGHDFTKLPKADIIMVTHEHHDHFDPKAIETVSNADTRLISNSRVAKLANKGVIVAPGDTIELLGFNIIATPAYNTTEGHRQYHPKERKDVGFLYDIDGLRIYVAGDTEDIPEMASLKDIDIAFLPVNQPFTMTPQQAIHAINIIKPKIVYPYHYGETNLTLISDAFKDNNNIEVRIKQLQ